MTGMALIQRSLEPGALEAFEAEECIRVEESIAEMQAFALMLMRELQRRIDE